MPTPTIHSFSIVSQRNNLRSESIFNTIFPDSGHGGQTKDLDGDEEDGYDEGLYWKLFQSCHIMYTHKTLSYIPIGLEAKGPYR